MPCGPVNSEDIAMNSLEFVKKLRGGELLFGTLVVSPSPMWPTALEGAGLDFVFIDTEHIALDRAQVSWMCRAYAHMGLPPLVRIPSPDPFEATKVLDGGAAGIIAPYVETAQQVQALRGAVKLRPVKGRRLADRLDGDPFEPTLEDYLRGRNTNALVVNIESVPAIEALDEILAVPDLDAVLIGPHDLSCSLGIPECYEKPEFLAACETILRKARAAGVAAGVHYWGAAEEQARFVKYGVNLLIHSSDITLVRKHLRQELAAVKKAIGIKSRPGPAGDALQI
jgi:2-keto-3-deoxy-L-rhamnonate aldolase RhmA